MLMVPSRISRGMWKNILNGDRELHFGIELEIHRTNFDHFYAFGSLLYTFVRELIFGSDAFVCLFVCFLD